MIRKEWSRFATRCQQDAFARERRLHTSHASMFVSGNDGIVFGMWGANTDVGKTLVSAGLLRTAVATLGPESSTMYLKPVQTGFPEDSDARFVSRVVSDAGSSVRMEVGSHAADIASQDGLFQDINAMQKIQNPRKNITASSMLARTLFAWKIAASPHLAVEREGRPVFCSDIVGAIRQELKRHTNSLVLVETAGGPGSPSPDGKMLQCDMLRTFRWPAVLIGDGKLGGISTTISSYEMLKVRGYSVPVVAVMEDWQQLQLGNHTIIEKYVDDDTVVIPLSACQPPEENQQGKELDSNLKRWLGENVCGFKEILNVIRDDITSRESWMQSAGSKAMEKVWWPFTQHDALLDSKDVTVIDSRNGENFVVYEHAKDVQNDGASGQLVELYDGCASWWTQGMDAASVPGMALTISNAIGRYGHVIFPRNIHKVALDAVDEVLKHVGGGWATRVFFSDNGSTAVEVALKMAFRKYMVDHNILEDGSIGLEVLGVHGAYHGDTLGAMDAVAPSVFTGRLQTPWFTGRGRFLDVPTVQMTEGKWFVSIPQEIHQSVGGRDQLIPLDCLSIEGVFSSARDDHVRTMYEAYIRQVIDNKCSNSFSKNKSAKRMDVGACIIEPVVQGAGGMRLIDPEFHRAMAGVCAEKKIPVIVDEVFTGLWRLGVPSASSHLLGIRPDIGCYAKLLTGGVVPMSMTLASEAVFDAFRGTV